MNKSYVDVIESENVERVLNYIKDDLRKRLNDFKGKKCTTDILMQIRRTILGFCDAGHLRASIKFDVTMKDPESSEICIVPRNLITGMFINGVPVEFLIQVKDDCKEITVENTGTPFDGCKFGYTEEDGFMYQPKEPAKFVVFKLFDCFDRKEI